MSSAQAQENVWVAFATGIMGQKTKFLTPYYPDGSFLLTGKLAPEGLTNPTKNLGSYAMQVCPRETKRPSNSAAETRDLGL